MGCVRCSDEDRLDAIRRDQGSRVRKDSGARGSGLRAGGVGVEDPREMRVGDLATDEARMF
jgi:hypothetical protein